MRAVPNFKVIIPARYASTRLPGKPLLPIGGKPMVVHVLARAIESGASEVLVATDDQRIVEAVEAHGGRAMMTSLDHVSGTDRLAEVAERLQLPDGAIVVNVQGDEPQVPSALITRLALALEEHPDSALSTVATPISSTADVWNPNVVKVVVDGQGHALYFSRAPIPWVRGTFSHASPVAELPAVPLLRHIGLYAYRVGTLRRLAKLPAAEIEKAESLEQLRALHAGMRILVHVVDEAPAHGVDTAEDLARVSEAFSS